MDVLILGLSNVVTRRALPALTAIPSIQQIDIATRQAAQPEIRAGWGLGAVFDDYATALDQTHAQLVYVSLVNSEHERWTRAALESGHDVVVDKPAFLGAELAESMVDLASQRGVCLAEATVFGYHPQVGAVREAFAAAGSAPTRIAATLSFPPMDPANFRYRSDLGGGALWDVGPYLAATGRIFYGGEPEAVHCQVLARGGVDNVDIAFSALGIYSNGRSLVGHFGFDTGYSNRLELLGPSIGVDLERAFTTPPDLATSVRVSGPTGATTSTVPAADSFQVFFQHVVDCIEDRRQDGLAADLLGDARTLARYRAAAGCD